LAPFIYTSIQRIQENS